jgi:hypothetical protein
MFKRLLITTAAIGVLTVTTPADARQKNITYDREAKLFRLSSGGEPFVARFSQSRQGKGPVQIDIAARHVLTGEYASVKNADRRWGRLFDTAVGGSGAGVNIKGLQRGTISAKGGGISIQCEYVTTSSRQSGFGFCKDSTDMLYRLLF